MEFITQWLRNPYEIQSTQNTDLYKNISLLSVVGLGGMGKTTLLQHVYNEDATNVFDVKMWVCVSINFDTKTVVKNMLESLKNKKSDQETLESLQKSLQSEVTSKRFLLVLDDIWEEDDAKWENVLAPLQYGSSRSKIVITTRLDSVAKKFANLIKKRKETLQLKGLEEEECLKLFNSHAFAGVENPDDEFKSIAIKMVEKLSGCPLAAKVIGGIMNSYIDKSYWIKILNTTIGKVGQGQNHLLPILKLSYTYLPKFLQNCFSFCCIFPQDHLFDKDDLVRMWISLGFIDSSNIQEETPEDIGRRYFNILVQKSFFDEFRHNYSRIYYKIHDLLHELAQFVAAQECRRIVGDRAFPIPPTTRHLSINDISSLEPAIKKLGEVKNLRSLFLSFSDGAELNESVICKILMASKSIRLLAISSEDINVYKMIEDIGCLIHLRYLKVKGFYDFKLPRSISHLYHLQFIVLRRIPGTKIGWKELMPNENCQIILDCLTIKDPSATNLIMEPLRRICSFRRLRFELNDQLVSFPSETMQWLLQYSSSLFDLTFAHLQSLESLPSSLECLSSIDYLSVENVPQLKLLPNPPASLVSLDLLHLKSLQCLPSSLSTISSLRNIYLKELENLDYLPSCLPTHLLQLNISEVPRLLELPDLPSSMVRLEIENLKSLKCLPSSLSTFSSLTYLNLKTIPLLKSLPNLPCSLKTLYLEDLKSLEYQPSSLSTISSLTDLKLKSIPLLKSLPDLPSSLKTYLEDIESLECLPSSLSAISSLESLMLIKLPLLKSLPDLPSSLKTLYLENLESLESLPTSLSAIPSLEALELNDIPLLKSLPYFPSSLKKLYLHKLESLESLPSSLSAIPSLETLQLHDIPLLKSLPDLASSLKKLKLCGLESLESLPSSLSVIPSLEALELNDIPLLKSLPNLPSSLKALYLEMLENLDCLPSCLPTRLCELEILKAHRLLELPDHPASLEVLYIEECDPQLMEHYPNSGSPRLRFLRFI